MGLLSRFLHRNTDLKVTIQAARHVNDTDYVMIDAYAGEDYRVFPAHVARAVERVMHDLPATDRRLISCTVSLPRSRRQTALLPDVEGLDAAVPTLRAVLCATDAAAETLRLERIGLARQLLATGALLGEVVDALGRAKTLTRTRPDDDPQLTATRDLLDVLADQIRRDVADIVATATTLDGLLRQVRSDADQLGAVAAQDRLARARARVEARDAAQLRDDVAAVRDAIGELA